MIYKKPKTSGVAIHHQFSDMNSFVNKSGSWDYSSIGFCELKTNNPKRSFMISIRYSDSKTKNTRISQVKMNKEELQNFINVLQETVDDEPKFKEKDF